MNWQEVEPLERLRSQVVGQVVLLKRVGLKAMWNFVKVFASHSTDEAFGLQEERCNKQADQSGLAADRTHFHRSESPSFHFIVLKLFQIRQP